MNCVMGIKSFIAMIWCMVGVDVEVINELLTSSLLKLYCTKQSSEKFSSKH